MCIWLIILLFSLYRVYKLSIGYSNSIHYKGYHGLFFAIVQLALMSSLIMPVFDQPYSGSLIWLLFALVERGYWFEGRDDARH